jgi:membrane-bound lytic murein transglycosylase D
MMILLPFLLLAPSSTAPLDEMVALRRMEAKFFARQAAEERRRKPARDGLRGWRLKRALGPGGSVPSTGLSSRQAGTPPPLDIPWTMNRSVARYMAFFTGPGRRTFQIWLDRSATMIPRIHPVLARAGAPRSLVYLAMIESGFRATARSHAGAQGVWQFIGPTGRAFGLRTGHFVDERADLDKATQAAARYLLRLHDRFGDWHLAFAAYNTGPGRVARALHRRAATSYWEIRDVLPRETANYVPKMLAAATLASAPARYGFRPPSGEAPVAVRSLPVARPLELKKIAEVCGIDPVVLIDLNPTLKQKITPPEHLYGSPFGLRVPEATPEDCSKKLVALPVAENRFLHTYKVLRGDTLSGIAAKWGTSVSTLVRANNLGRRSTLRLGQRIFIPLTQAKR